MCNIWWLMIHFISNILVLTTLGNQFKLSKFIEHVRCGLFWEIALIFWLNVVKEVVKLSFYQMYQGDSLFIVTEINHQSAFKLFIMLWFDGVVTNDILVKQFGTFWYFVGLWWLIICVNNVNFTRLTTFWPQYTFGNYQDPLSW